MKNNYTINGQAVFVTVKRGGTGELFTFQCDVSDLELLKQRSWVMHSKSVSVGGTRRVNGKCVNVSLQKHLIGASFIDFLNGDRLDFRRVNMAPLEKKKVHMIPGAKIKGNRIDVHGDTATVWTKKSGGKAGAFLIDAADVRIVEKYTWFMLHPGYPVAWTHGGRKNSKKILLHRYLTNAQPGQEVDHKNRIKFDARRQNLRISTRSQNMHNVVISHNNQSGVTGVKQSSKNRWRSTIQIDGNILDAYHPTFAQAVSQRKEWEETYNPAGLE
jgi:hypothetical protein